MKQKPITLLGNIWTRKIYLLKILSKEKNGIKKLDFYLKDSSVVYQSSM